MAFPFGAASTVLGPGGALGGGPNISSADLESNPEFTVGSPFAVGSGATATVPNALGASGAIDSLGGAILPLAIIGAVLLWVLKK